MSNLDSMIEDKENLVKDKISKTEEKIEALILKKLTNGYFIDENKNNVNIFVHKDPEVIFNLTKHIVKLKLVHDEAVSKLGDSLPRNLINFSIENPRSKNVSYEEAICDFKLALEIIHLKEQLKKYKIALVSLAKNYSDEKKKEIEVNELFKSIDEI